MLPTSPSSAVELTIEKLVYGGDGLGRLPAEPGRASGKAVFVPDTLPGEQVLAEVEDESHVSYLRAKLLQILAPSPHRVAPGCRYFGRCGGCQWQHLEPAIQLQAKEDVLRETLARTGKIRWPDVISTHASPPWEYRNRSRLRLTLRPERIGYYRRDSHELIAVGKCPISAPLISRAIASIAVGPPPPESAREVEFAVDHRNQALIAEFGFAPLAPDAEAYVRTILPSLHGCVSAAALDMESGRRLQLQGPGFLEYEANGERYRVSHSAFFQVNRFLVDELSRTVVAGLEGTHALDLFSGVGLFTLPLARRFAHVCSVERDPISVADLKANVRALDHVQVHESAAEAALVDESLVWDAAVLDPPRTGLGRNLIARLLHRPPAQLRLVSCDPATLGRDLASLLAGGYRISAIHLFDLFPQTYHIETMVEMER